MPIHLQRLERNLAFVAGVWLALGLGSSAYAHGDAEHLLPIDAGARVGISAALSHIDASLLLPSNRMAGYLLQGDPGTDRRGSGVEHVVVDAGWRINDTWGAALAVGQHGTDQSHVEDAWIQAGGFVENDEWLLTAGRQKPELGQALTSAGHMDRFASVPLAKRVAVNDDWIDDGVQFGWRRNGLDLQWRADVGWWNGQVFPGASGSAPGPALHAGVTWGDWSLDGFVARLEPKGRGAVASAVNGGHTHAAPVCDALLRQVVCFDGSSELSGGSVRWSNWPVTATAAIWMRRDNGTLASSDGLANYTGDNQGAWADVVWQFYPKLEAGLRMESVMANHKLVGSGTRLLVSETGLNAYQAGWRNALMFGYIPGKNLELRLESGQEQVAGIQGNYVAIRAIASADYLFGKN